MDKQICPILMLLALGANGSETTQEVTNTVTCKKSKCAWWVQQTPDEDSGECCLSFIANALNAININTTPR